MALISEARMAELLAPYFQLEGAEPIAAPAGLIAKLGAYLELLVRWNARTNLTAVRAPEEIVTRHFGESLFAGVCLRDLESQQVQLLDLGSGAGFPGLPMQLLYPGWKVSLAESQGKKAAFLREAVRVLGLQTEVWAARVEEMPADRTFDVVALRAVDQMEAMTQVGRARVRLGGRLVEMVGPGQVKVGADFVVRHMPGPLDSLVMLTRIEH